jgi:protein-S-isoprenylcysteine O-methyltransferase Ste14
MKLNLWSLAALIALILWMAYTAGHTPWTAMRWTGVAITVPSVVLLGIARLQLGRSFSVRAKTHKLVTHGMYRYCRHPVYLFGGLAIIGVSLYFDFPGFPWLPLAALVVVPVQIVRARREESLLQQEFGEEYSDYRARTWF